jgi:hypothetical protein
MPGHHPTEEHIATGQSSLLQAFPGARQWSWWEEHRRAQVFALTDGAVLRHSVIDGGLLHTCPDWAVALAGQRVHGLWA